MLAQLVEHGNVQEQDDGKKQSLIVPLLDDKHIICVKQWSPLTCCDCFSKSLLLNLTPDDGCFQRLDRWERTHCSVLNKMIGTCQHA